MPRLFAVWMCACLAAAVEVSLIGPLTTMVPADGTLAGPRQIVATVIVPANAPSDLGIGAMIRDRDGRWFQRIEPLPLQPGTTTVRFAFRDSEPGDAHPMPASLRASDLVECDRSGIFFWSSEPSTATVQVEIAVTAIVTATPTAPVALRDLHLDGFDPQTGHCAIACGERWALSVTPTPFPSNPFDPDEFRLDAEISGPDGLRRIPGFFNQAVALSDRGDRQAARRHGESHFDLRFRPAQPGTYTIRLIAHWADGRELTCDLPDLHARGPAVDTLVRVDEDRRFFRIGDKPWWPIGINLHSTYDLRSREVLDTRLTPDRGSLVYQAILPRIAAAGIDFCEIWMSSWNLALEWRNDWPGYAGLGRFNLGNAERFDDVLDTAWSHGVRINVTLNNHGQASPKADREWKDNPWNSINGGPISDAAEMFSNEAVAAGQERVRRYLAARYADHPAIFGWKLWSEVDLTAGRGEPLVRWHDQAAERWQALDAYGHACTTHWCGTYTHVNPDIAALDRIGYLCIDAYRGTARDGSGWRPITQLLADSLWDANRGLARWNKPLLTTEYGASGKAPLAMRFVDLRLAPFSGVVSGHAGAPMTWWWEWVDQNGLWDSYRAVRAFMTDEDLRGADARSLALLAKNNADDLWCRAWVRPGRLLGYLVDDDYATNGKDRPLENATITIGTTVAPGRMRDVWYDADNGAILRDHTFDHRGGALQIQAPPFRAHIAFKLIRLDTDGSDP